MNKSITKKYMRPMAVVLTTVFLLIIACTCAMPFLTAYADELDYKAEERAKDFMSAMYDAKCVSYTDFTTLYSVDLYDDENTAIAQVSVFDRDGKIDYAVYNYVTENIDEYGFDYEQALTDFAPTEKIYYAGSLTYYCEVGDALVDKASGETVSRTVLTDKIRDYKDNLLATRKTRATYGGKPADGGQGIINWKDIRNGTSGWENSDWKYLKGITFSSATGDSGISGDGLSFSSMSSFSKSGTITNHCGPTALTNIMIYYKWRGMDTLISNNRQSTFDRLRVLCKHDKNCTTYMSDARTAITTYLKERGYTATLTNFSNDFAKYKSAIDNDQVVLTLLNVKEAGGNEWGHFVVTLGYEEFRQEYEKEVLWWTETAYNYLRYIRVCDGWGSCNENRYVDLNNFYDSYTNSAISVK